MQRFPAILARFAAQKLDADVAAAREVWPHLEQLVAGATPPAAEHDATNALRTLLAREGANLATQARAAHLIRDALAGQRWVPRL